MGIFHTLLLLCRARLYGASGGALFPLLYHKEKELARNFFGLLTKGSFYDIIKKKRRKKEREKC
jgi:hypothetical protein